MTMIHFEVSFAFKHLAYRRRQLALSTAGIGFAALLICMQVGFLNALFDAQVEIVDAIDGDLFILSSGKYTLVTRSPFPARRLRQAAAAPGVIEVTPILVEYEVSVWRNPDLPMRRSMRVFGVDPDAHAFRDPAIGAQLHRLRVPDTLLIDEASKNEFGSDLTPGVATELGRSTVVIVGTFRLGTDFVNDANAIMSDRTFLKLFPGQRSADPDTGRVEIGIIRLDEGAEPREVQSELRSRLPDDVRVLTREELRELELQFWRASTPIGTVFRLGAAMAVLIGVVICYQILFTDVVEHLPQFGTMMAMGFHSRRIVALVLTEALVIAVAGVVPALIAGSGLYAVVGALTGLPMRLTLGRALAVVGATLFLCLASGLMAVRRALKIDPAELFA